MSTFGLPATCLACGGPLELTTGSTQAGTATNAVLRCAADGSEYLVAVQLRRISAPKNVRRQDQRTAAKSPDTQLDLLQEGA